MRATSRPKRLALQPFKGPPYTRADAAGFSQRVLIDRTLAEVRLEAGANKRERVSIAELIEETFVIALAAGLRVAAKVSHSLTMTP
jgi:hypothetical protein